MFLHLKYMIKKPSQKLRYINKHLYSFGLGLLLLVIFISHLLYVLKTRQYPEQDEHAYLDMSIKFYDILKHPSLDSFSQIIAVNKYRQPLYGLFLAMPLLIFGTAHTYKIALLFNYVFYALTIVGIYLLGKEFLTKKASFLASFIFAFYGFPLFYLHFTYSETATTAFVVLSLLFLAKSNFFLIWKNTFFFSLFFTLGNLIRWVVPIFVGGSFMWTFVRSLYNQTKQKVRDVKKLTLNIGIFMLVGVLPVVIIYYLPNLSFFSGYVTGNTDNASNWVADILNMPELKNTFSIRSIMFYFNILSQQTVFFFALFIAGFLLSIVYFKKYIFFLLAFLLAYGVFTFGSVLKFDRYIVPIYPSMALISAVTFDYIKNKKLGFALITLTLIIGSLNFLGASWGIGPLGQQGLKDIVLPEFIHHPRRIYITTMVWPPRENELNAEEAFSFIEKDYKNNAGPPHAILAFAYHPFENAWHKIVAYEKRGKNSIFYYERLG